MRCWLIAFWLCWAGLLCLPLAAGAEEGAPLALPALTGRVVDMTATLTPPQKTQLETDLKQLETDKGAQAAILLLPSVKPESIEQFGIRLAEAWKLGRKGVDDGLIIIVAKNDRRIRIEVGYGLEGVVPDAVAKRIVSEHMAPRFKQGDYYGGLQDAVQALTAAIGSEAGGQGAGGEGTSGGEHAVPPSAAANDGGEPWWMDSNLLTFGLIVGAGILHALFGIMGYVAAAGVVGVIVYFATASWLLGLGAAIAVFLLALFGGGRSGPGGFISSGGSSWGSSSDSGFSGGGGSFGGGGASGDW